MLGALGVESQPTQEREGRGMFARKQNQKLTEVITNLPQVIQQVWRQDLNRACLSPVANKITQGSVALLHTF